MGFLCSLGAFLPEVLAAQGLLLPPNLVGTRGRLAHRLGAAKLPSLLSWRGERGEGEGEVGREGGGREGEREKSSRANQKFAFRLLGGAASKPHTPGASGRGTGVGAGSLLCCGLVPSGKLAPAHFLFPWPGVSHREQVPGKDPPPEATLCSGRRSGSCPSPTPPAHARGLSPG